MSGWRRLRHGALAVAAGSFLAGSVVQGPLPALAFAYPLAMLSLLEAPSGSKRRYRRAFVLGWLAGTGCNATALYWIPGLLYDFAGFPYVAGVPVALLLAASQGLTLAFACLFAEVVVRPERSVSLVRSPGSAASEGASSDTNVGVPRWLAFPAAISLVFSLSPALFPWRFSTGAVGWIEWAQIAELGGPPMLDFVLVLVGSAAWEAMRRPRALPIVVGALALGGPALYGAWRLPQVEAARASAPAIEVGVVQPNVSIEEKHDIRLANVQLRLLRQMTRELEAEGAELVIWPESAHPIPYPRGGTRDHRGSAGVLRDGVRGPVLFGVITRGEDRCDRWNSAVALGADGVISGVSDKVELLAFGETVPLWDVLPPLQDMFPCPGIRPGARPESVTLAGASIGVLNCYEDVLAEHARTVAKQWPDFLVNVTNDAWFGDTREPHLHQLVARHRTIETRRELVRAVNTGVSSHVAATGETVIETPTFVRTGFVSRVPKLGGVTPWVWLGDVFTPTFGALFFVAAFARRRYAR
ncbi:MAG: apolipoprotein N-acyltransferase [Sandaracinus sp.]|nr:apolipoprotein N-acyltransferase [Sandaracinus sp.]